MGKIIAFALLMFLAACANAAELKIVSDENAQPYCIVISLGASPSEMRAAKELRRFIYEMTDCFLRIKPDTPLTAGKSIIIGDGEAMRSLLPDEDLTDLGDEGYIIKTVGDNLIIAGGRKRGTMYGVYGLLHSLGCRWFSDTESVIPKRDSIIISDTDIREKPFFEYRETYYFHSIDKDWAARNRTNGFFSKLDDNAGGKMEYKPFVHSFEELLPRKEYMEKHQEWFSTGKHIGQICLTNPEVLKIAKAKVFEWIEQNPSVTIFSVSQNDGLGDIDTCKCASCMKVYEEEGAWSGVLLRFVNAIAEDVEKKYPDKLIDTLAYQWSVATPKVTKPRANVRIRLCSSNCKSHPATKCDESGSAEFVKALSDWSAVTDNLYIWHYCTNFLNYLYPFPHFDQAADSAKLYADSGVKGVFWQGSYNGYCGAMAELSAYMMAQLSWNPYQDYKIVMRDFFDNYYGAAAPFIAEYVQNMQDYVASHKDFHLHMACAPNMEYFTADDISEASRLFDEAEKAVADNPDYLRRVQKSRLSVTFSHIMLPLTKNKTVNKTEINAEFEKFAEDCRKYNVNMREGTPLESSLSEIRSMIENAK